MDGFNTLNDLDANESVGSYMRRRIGTEFPTEPPVLVLEREVQRRHV